VKIPEEKSSSKKATFHLDTAENPDVQNLPDSLDEADTLSASQALAEAESVDPAEKEQKEQDD